MYRINELIQQNKRLFHTNDFALLWGMSNRNSLYTTISRYIDRGILFPVYKGLYATVPVENLDPIELGRAVIHRFTYLSTESVLQQAGILSQRVYDYTFIADQSKRIEIGKWSFRYRQLKAEFLYHPEGLLYQGDGFIASTERAAADLLYFNPRYHFDVPALLDLEKVRELQKTIGYTHA